MQTEVSEIKTKFRSIISIVMALILTLSLIPSAFAAGDSLTTDPLYFNEDGKFRIMHLTDTHLTEKNVDDTVWLIANACDRENPDLVVLSGDYVSGGDREEIIDKLMNSFEQRSIPVAVCFGNHDSENGDITREEYMALFNSYSCSISIDDGEQLSGCGTYNIPIYSNDGGELKFNIWIFDSGDYDEDGNYGCVQADQVEWYKEKSAENERTAGGKVYSLAFQHIIVPEVFDALKKVDRKMAYSCINWETGDYYVFDPEVENHGFINDNPGPGTKNFGQFDAMVERGDVLGIFSGHDHMNAFSVKNQGINITNTVSTRYNGDAFSTQYGYRIIDVDESDTSTYETRVVRWYDIYTPCEATRIWNSGDKAGAMLVHKINFLGFFEHAVQVIGPFAVKMFTGRTVVYK